MGAYALVVRGHRTIELFSRKHANVRKSLARFVKIAEQAQWKHLPDVKNTFPATGYVAASGTLIFDVGGNNYRITARVDFEQQTMWIDSIQTHAEHDKE
jgi:mRNA interferase HigB